MHVLSEQKAAEAALACLHTKVNADKVKLISRLQIAMGGLSGNLKPYNSS